MEPGLQSRAEQAAYHESSRRPCHTSGIRRGRAVSTLGGSFERVERHAPRGDGLQRFFGAFPGSWPGAGLLLLRTLVGGAATAQGGAYLAGSADAGAGTWLLGAAAVASGASLVVGFLTPGAGAVAGLSTTCIAIGVMHTGPGPLLHGPAALFVAADAAAVILLGPGASSVDARLFGRREIVIPPQPQPRLP